MYSKKSGRRRAAVVRPARRANLITIMPFIVQYGLGTRNLRRGAPVLRSVICLRLHGPRAGRW
jgi:hypothetical protein